MRAYIDTDILIRHLCGEQEPLEFLKRMRDIERYELYTGIFQRAEVLFFMRPNEQEGTELFLSQFKAEPVDKRTVNVAAALYRKWHFSHGVDTKAAFLAATVMETGGRIYTLHVEQYPMPEVQVCKAW